MLRNEEGIKHWKLYMEENLKGKESQKMICNFLQPSLGLISDKSVWPCGFHDTKVFPMNEQELAVSVEHAYCLYVHCFPVYMCIVFQICWKTCRACLLSIGMGFLCFFLSEYDMGFQYKSEVNLLEPGKYTFS